MMGSGRRALGLLLAFSLAVALGLGSSAATPVYRIPDNCKRLECPSYTVVHSQADFEIRRYQSVLWMSTPPLNSTSYTDATGRGFSMLFSYIQGKNSKGAVIEMTAPVMVDVEPSTGPFCNSSFAVHLYMPKQYQQGKPPLSSEVIPTRLPVHRYAAVRRFGGFMNDSNIAPQVSLLRTSLKGSPWQASLAKTRGGGYTLAGYNSPFEYKNRVNEVLLWFD
ncbi:hypothetical protein SAY87_013065 [Trapa incisa]|uniref:SOUL heme-binding protein n=1 Tax=Trapa incisa TaxID=236973 RepID=A0AAN7KHC6_9MYRT|nr:hypothetical protein SAY87_013065 [Trapa incisa]